MYVVLTSILIFAAISAGCVTAPIEESDHTAPIEKSDHTLLVTVPPMIEIVSAVAGEGFAIHSIVPEGMSPHTYEPTPAELSSFAEADIWFTLDGFFPQEDRIAVALPYLKRVETGAKVLAISKEGGKNGEMDPHIWVSAQNGILMTEAVQEGLSAHYTELTKRFSDRADAFCSELSNVDNQLSSAASAMDPKAFLATHGSFGYFAKDYSIKQLVISHIGKEPTARSLSKIIDSAKEVGVRIIVTEPLLGKKSAMVLSEELGIVPVQINPLSTYYIDMLKSLTEVLVDGKYFRS